MRAVSCVTQRAAHDAVALRAARGWTTQEDAPGLALAVVEQLDALPAEVASELADGAVARLGKDRRFDLLVRPKLERSVHAPVRDKVAEPISR